jgi:hypothetical protein
MWASETFFRSPSFRLILLAGPDYICFCVMGPGVFLACGGCFRSFNYVYKLLPVRFESPYRRVESSPPAARGPPWRTSPRRRPISSALLHLWEAAEKPPSPHPLACVRLLI